MRFGASLWGERSGDNDRSICLLVDYRHVDGRPLNLFSESRNERLVIFKIKKLLVGRPGAIRSMLVPSGPKSVKHHRPRFMLSIIRIPVSLLDRSQRVSGARRGRPLPSRAVPEDRRANRKLAVRDAFAPLRNHFVSTSLQLHIIIRKKAFEADSNLYRHRLS
ncbi:hypothetical protein EVAR_80603_1 [Eumeta japonica]|uniref:Uncharacterized protein n=1 Tax=Eumeta variegata TaxID=151549 RepID=A0A4C1TLP6_EUMVA|nr:hypothetical protein EVAR_80603_1 [Eumeta japonica]